VHQVDTDISRFIRPAHALLKSSPEEITSVGRVPAMWSAMPAISWNYIVPLLDLSATVPPCTRLSLASQQEIRNLCHSSDYRFIFVTMISNIKNFSGKLFSLENVLNISDSVIYRKYVVFFL